MSDILQSASMIVGPFAPPSETPSFIAPWAIGDDLTCQMQGFLFSFASGATPMYLFGLCLYTVTMMNSVVPKEIFSRKIEKAMHISIICLNLTVSSFSLATRTMNTTDFGGICMFAEFPTCCKQIPQIVGGCDERISKYVPFLRILYICFPGLCLVGIICCMGIIIWQEIVKKPNSPETSRASLVSAIRSSNISIVVRRNQDQNDRSGSRLTTTAGLPTACGKNNCCPGVRIAITTTSCCPTDTTSNKLLLKNKKYCYVDNNYEFERHLNKANNNLDSAGGNQQTIVVNDMILTREKGHEVPIANEDDHRSSNNSESPATPLRRRRTRNFTRRQYRREIVTQASLYVLAFLLTFSCSWSVQLKRFHSNQFSSKSLIMAVHFFYPLGGFFNVLVYSRPKIRAFRIRNSTYSWVSAFWHVIKTGGDASVIVPTRSARSSSSSEQIDPRRASFSQDSTAFIALNAPPATNSSSGRGMSNRALNNNSQSFSTSTSSITNVAGGGYRRTESSWNCIIGGGSTRTAGVVMRSFDEEDAEDEDIRSSTTIAAVVAGSYSSDGAGEQQSARSSLLAQNDQIKGEVLRAVAHALERAKEQGIYYDDDDGDLVG